MTEGVADDRFGLPVDPREAWPALVAIMGEERARDWLAGLELALRAMDN